MCRSGRTRTLNFRLWRPTLYQLNYTPRKLYLVSLKITCFFTTGSYFLYSNFSGCILLFFVMINNLKINKNFFIFFKLKKECIGYNFFPDWPNKYLNLTLFESFIFWLKKFLYIFLNLKKIKYIIIKKK